MKSLQKDIIIACDSPGLGGSEIDLLRVAQMLNGAYSIGFVCSDSDKAIKRFADNHNLGFQDNGRTGNRLTNVFTGLFRAADLVNHNRSSIFVVWAHHLDSNRWLQLGLALFGRSFVVCERTGPASRQDFTESRSTPFIVRIVSRFAKLMVVCGHGQVNHLQSVVGGRVYGIIAVPNSRPVFKIRDQVRLLRSMKLELREKIGIPPGCYLLVMVGRVCADKNQRFVIELIKQDLLEKNVCFLVVGDGPDNKSLKEHVSNAHLGDRVFFVGQQIETSPYYAMADAFVFPSKFEGLSGALIEAMAAELPCLASDIIANRELISNEKTGWLFPLEDAANLAAKVNGWATNPEKAAKCASDGFAHVQAFYDESCECANWRHVFRHLIGLQNPPII